MTKTKTETKKQVELYREKTLDGSIIWQSQLSENIFEEIETYQTRHYGKANYYLKFDFFESAVAAKHLLSFVVSVEKENDGQRIIIWEKFGLRAQKPASCKIYGFVRKSIYSKTTGKFYKHVSAWGATNLLDLKDILFKKFRIKDIPIEKYIPLLK